MSPRELEQQIQQFLDGTLSAEEQDRLTELLLEDADALELYRQHALLDSSLTRLLEGKMSLTDKDNIATLAEERSRFRSLRTTWLAAAAILTVSLITLRFILIANDPPALTFRSVPDTVFKVSPPVGSDHDPDPGTLTVGSSLDISQGTMELVLASGVRSIVQAPVQLTLDSRNQIDLHEGTAWFHVPPGARGFRVTTPELDIVDLGTEFGVLSTPDDFDEVHVFSGMVEARSRRADHKALALTAKQARRSDPTGELKITSLRPSEFLTTLPDELPHLYFSFDGETDGQLEVAGPHPHAAGIEAELISPDPSALLVPSAMGHALKLSGDRDHVVTDWPGFPGTTPRSVAFWLRIPAGTLQADSLPAMVGWGDPTQGMNAKWKVTLAQTEDGHSFPRISFGVERFDGSTILNDGEWHHFVAIYSGRTLARGLPEVAIHIDGRRESLTRNIGSLGNPDQVLAVGTLTNTFKARPLRIGVSVMGLPDSVHGEIDELYIYQGAISEDTIHALISEKP